MYRNCQNCSKVKVFINDEDKQQTFRTTRRSSCSLPTCIAARLPLPTSTVCESLSTGGLISTSLRGEVNEAWKISQEQLAPRLTRPLYQWPGGVEPRALSYAGSAEPVAEDDNLHEENTSSDVLHDTPGAEVISVTSKAVVAHARFTMTSIRYSTNTEVDKSCTQLSPTQHTRAKQSLPFYVRTISVRSHSP